MGARLRGHKTNLIYTKLATFQSMKIIGQDYAFFKILLTRVTCSLLPLWESLTQNKIEIFQLNLAPK
jgi:hypothetical protein